MDGVDEDDDETLEDDGLPTAPKTSKLRVTRSASAISSSTASSEVDSQKDVDVTDSRACSVCSASSSPMSTLKPCGHLICSSCLTGALNIVGEKDMRCATCEQPVDDFKLLTPMKLDSPISVKESSQVHAPSPSLNRGPRDVLTLLPSAFDELAIKETRPSVDDLSQNQPSVALPTVVAEIAVLRIDNVPWVTCCIFFFSTVIANTVLYRTLRLPLWKTSSHHTPSFMRTYYSIQRGKLCRMHMLR